MLSSQIEGTRTDLTQLLEYEATGFDEGLPEDAAVTLGYVRALDHGLRAIRRDGGLQHLTLDLIWQLHRVLMSGTDYRHPEGANGARPPIERRKPVCKRTSLRRGRHRRPG